MTDWNTVTADHVRKAMELFDKGEKLPSPREKGRNTFLIANGKEYDAKFIWKTSYRLASGKDAPGFAGGLQTVNFFKRLGFVTRYKNTEESDALKKLYDRFKEQYLSLRTPHGAETGQWSEGYKWRQIPPLAQEVFSTPITPANVRERVDTLRKHLSNFADFRDFSGLLELPEKEAAAFLNVVKTMDEDRVAETIEKHRTHLKSFLTNRSFGAPLWGFLLAATDSARFPIFKDGVFQSLVNALGETDEWKSTKPGERYAQFRTYCLQIGEWLQKENIQEFSADKTTVRPGLTALDGQDFIYVWAQKQRQGKATTRYWIYAPGSDASGWETCLSESSMGIGFRVQEDLSRYETKEEYLQLLRGAYGLNTDAEPTNNALALFEFTHVMKKGDVVFVKKGRDTILGWGIVDSEYRYDPDGVPFPHVRSVEWKASGEWESPETTGIKTLTDITSYPAFVASLLSIFDMATSSPLPMDLNLILYGPPGTGKTYELAKTYMPLFTDKDSTSLDDYFETIVQPHSRFVAIAAALLDLRRGSVADILKHPLVQANFRQSATQNQRQMIWGNLQNHTILDSKTVHTSLGRRQDPLLFDKGDDSVWTLDEQKVETDAPEVKQLLAQYLKPPQTHTEKRYEFITFHQSYSYEEFMEGIRPETDESGNVIYKIRDGIFKRLVTRAKENPNKSYALFIDEINRGNISKIFGELITLLEPDKRLGAENELTVRLPYSGEEFGVPSNLHVIGTLNTADRSIALIDLALRRRFAFRGLYPLYDVPGLQYPELLRALNERIVEERGPDYQIGHSYFLEKGGAFDLKGTMQRNVLPLLSEYFYDDRDTVKALLASAGVETSVVMGQLVFERYSAPAHAKD